ncbi:MAG: tryptophan transporter [Clostridiales bacterium]|nr:tryptophan transporter [Clostridiales bacterium]
MDLRKSILTALLLAIGFILHHIVPGTLGGMKFDLFLAFIFISILLNSDVKNVVLTALLGGILTAMTTSFPGGQIPNIIDKMVTCAAVYTMLKVMGKYKDNQVFVGILSFIGTMISGTTFLASALALVGLPAPFMALFVSIVIPTSITNTFITIVIYQIVQQAIKVTGAKFV